MVIKTVAVVAAFTFFSLTWTSTSQAQSISFQAGGTGTINPSGNVPFFTGVPLEFPLIVTQDDGVAQAARLARARSAYRARREARDRRVRELRRQRAIARNQANAGYTTANLRATVQSTHQNLFHVYQQQTQLLRGYTGR